MKMIIEKTLLFKRLARVCMNLAGWKTLIGLLVVLLTMIFGDAFISEFTEVHLQNVFNSLIYVGIMMFAINAFNDEGYYPYKWNIIGRFFKHIASQVI